MRKVLATKQSPVPHMTGMELSAPDLTASTEGMIMRALELLFELKHPGQHANKTIPKLLHVGSSAYANAKADRGSIGCVKMLEFQKLAGSRIYSEFVRAQE